jgi:hypothetical protein
MFRFYFNKTEKSVGIGSYPKVTLNIARTVACEYKALVLAQTDTAIGQLLEMRANRGTDANVIVFDEDSVDASVAAA